MKAKILVAAALVALGACSNSGASGDGGNGIAAVRPSQVTPEALQAAVSDPRLREFYEARGWQPVWNAGTSEALVAAIGDAPRHGLDRRLFLADVERDAAPAAREAALSLAAFSYAEALARGRADPARLRDIYELPRPEVDVAAGLNAALEGNDLGDWFAGLAPQDEEYRALSEAYVAASRQAAQAQPVPAGAALRPGGADPRLPQIAAALAANGYVTLPQGQPAPARYGDDLAAAVRRLQEDYGLEANGVIGEATLAAINEGPRDRARALAVNLERRRWLAREAAPTRIDVNTAAATLAYWREGNVVDRRPVVVGQPGDETPQMASPIYRLVANPTWTVPQSIEEEEIAPKGAGYMARNNMSWRDGRIVQESGPTNSLGLVKFDMRNDHAIYLHDTPAKALFAEAERHRSHGCVRVNDALGFARMIAEQEGVLDEWERARATNEESFVALPREIPVRLMYQTAFLDGGRIRYRLDAYGWDDNVAEALGLQARPRNATRSHYRDVGP